MRAMIDRKPTFIDFFVCLYLAFSYLSESMRWARYAMFLSILAAALAFLLQHRGNIKISLRFGMLFLPFILFCFVSGLWASSPSLAVQKGITIAEIWMITAVIQLLYLEQPDAMRLIGIFKWSGLIEAAVVITFSGWSSIVSLLMSGTRLLSPSLGNANRIGIVMSYTIVLCLYDIISSDRRWVLNLKIVLPILVLILSQSRTAILSCVLLSAVLIVSQISDRDRRKRIAIITFIIVAAFVILIQKTTVLDAVVHRLNQLLGAVRMTDSADNSAVVRLKLIRTGLALWKSNPILGVGMDNARLYTIQDYYCHNDVVELLADGGIFGFLLYFGVFTVLAFRVHRIRDANRELSKLGMVLILLQLVLSFGSVHYYLKDTYYLALIYYTIVEETGVHPADTTESQTEILLGKERNLK